jgi:hypothetical protein
MPFPLSPPICPPDQADTLLRERGYAVLDAASLARLAGTATADFEAWRPTWNELPPDGHLKDGGRYRRRRHGCFVVGPGQRGDPARLEAMPHRAHWQPVEYNALHGGIERWFEPLDPAVAHDEHWARLLVGLADRATQLRGLPDEGARWYIEAHPFRIDPADGIGRPTPEGAHRDGVDLVAVVLVGRRGVKGGETRVFDARGPQGMRFTLSEPWSVLLLDDERVIHETTPIQPADAQDPGHRDTLVLTFRRDGFQGPNA